MAYTLQIILEILGLIFLYDYFRRVNTDFYDYEDLPKNVMTIIPTIICFIYLILPSRHTKTDPFINMLAPIAVAAFITPMLRGDIGLPFIRSKLGGTILTNVFIAILCIVLNQVFYNSAHFKEYWFVYLSAFSLFGYTLRNTVFSVNGKPKDFWRVVALFVFYSYCFYDSLSSFSDISFANWTQGFYKIFH